MQSCFAVVCLAAVSFSGFAQSPKVVTHGNVGPATLSETPYILWDADVVRHWPKTPAAMNLPAELTTLSPGQCLRVGADVQGLGHEHFFNAASIGFSVHYQGTSVEVPVAPIATVKQIKPVGMDQVNAALQAGKVQFAPPIYNSMAASAGRWCVPSDAAAGNVEVLATVLVDGKPHVLKPAKLSLVIPEMPPANDWKDDDAFQAWLMSYHLHPEPALLGPAIDRAFQTGHMSNTLDEAFAAAIKQDPACAERMGPWLARQGTGTQITAMVLLKQAGLALGQPVALDDEAKAAMAKFPSLDDPYQFSPDESQFEKLDRLWSRFMVTGDREPVDALVAMLAWHKDYPVFQKIAQAHATDASAPEPELTPSLIRGIAYTAVGWSIRSFGNTDPLASDYLLSIASDPSTPKDIQGELAGLDSNHAFDHK